jgi:hypothetical protein
MLFNPRNRANASSAVVGLALLYAMWIGNAFFVAGLVVVNCLLASFHRCPKCREMVGRNGMGYWTPYVPPKCRNCGCDLTDPSSYSGDSGRDAV